VTILLANLVFVHGGVLKTPISQPITTHCSSRPITTHWFGNYLCRRWCSVIHTNKTHNTKLTVHLFSNKQQKIEHSNIVYITDLEETLILTKNHQMSAVNSALLNTDRQGSV